MNYKQAMKYLYLTHVIEPTYADAGTEDALNLIGETIADLRAALETILGFLDEMAAFLDGDLAVWAETCRHTARAALAGSGEAGNEV